MSKKSEEFAESMCRFAFKLADMVTQETVIAERERIAKWLEAIAAGDIHVAPWHVIVGASWFADAIRNGGHVKEGDHVVGQ